MKIRILSYATQMPERVVKNSDLTQFDESFLPIIEQKTGIRERRHLRDDEKVSDIATAAGLSCIKKSNLKLEDIHGLIFATGTPDRLSPACASLIQNNLGLPNSFAFDMNTTCPNGIYSLEIGRSMLAGSSRKNILIINADAPSKTLDSDSFGTFPYFGDGCAAVILTKSDDASLPELMEGSLFSDGSGYNVITTRGGSSELPIRALTPQNREEYFFTMDGTAVFKFATTRPPAAIKTFMEKNNIPKDKVCAYILHQANTNIIAKFVEFLGEDRSKFPENIFKYGNTSGASTMVTLTEYLSGAYGLKKEGYAIVCGYGGGLAWGVSALKF